MTMGWTGYHVSNSVSQCSMHMDINLWYHPCKSDIWGLSDGKGCERFWSELQKLIPNLCVTGISLFYIQSMKVRIKILMHYYNSTIVDCSSLISRLNKVTE